MSLRSLLAALDEPVAAARQEAVRAEEDARRAAVQAAQQQHSVARQQRLQEAAVVKQLVRHVHNEEQAAVHMLRHYHSTSARRRAGLVRAQRQAEQSVAAQLAAARAARQQQRLSERKQMAQDHSYLLQQAQSQHSLHSMAARAKVKHGQLTARERGARILQNTMEELRPEVTATVKTLQLFDEQPSNETSAALTGRYDGVSGTRQLPERQ